MLFCSRCKVEITETHSRCPLCKSHLSKELKDPINSWPEDTPRQKVSPISWLKLRKQLVQVISIAFLSAILICLGISFPQNTQDWAITATVCLLASWAYCIALLYFWRRPTTAFIQIIIITSAFLYFIDRLGGPPEWFHALALPILLTIFICYVPVLKFLRSFSKLDGLAWTLIATSVCCILINLFTNYYQYQQWGVIFWSGIVSLILIPAAIFLLYLQYRIGKVLDLKKFFHT
ncbi:MAG: hypothetical protein MK193_10760 [Lentisphaeria bacterium]|nr:hypothetical protein [Lentisphaeria bacterium]